MQYCICGGGGGKMMILRGALTAISFFVCELSVLLLVYGTVETGKRPVKHQPDLEFLLLFALTHHHQSIVQLCRIMADRRRNSLIPI